MGRRRRPPWGVVLGVFVICLCVIVAVVVTRPARPPAPTPAPAVVPLAATFGPGDYVVGRQILPGTYHTAGPASNDASCSWTRRDLGDKIIAYKVSSAPDTVTILRTDVAFSTLGCEPWVRVDGTGPV